MKHLDERLAASQDAASKKFNILKEQMFVFQDSLKEERVYREQLEVTKEQEIVKVDAALQATLQAEQEALRATSEKILKVFEDKTDLLKDEISSSSKVRTENEARP